MKHNWLITTAILTLFFVAQLTGLIIVDKYIGEEGWKSLPSIIGVDIERPDVDPNISIIYMMVAIVLGTILILFIVSFKRVFIWKLWFFLSVTLCLQISFAAFINEIFAVILAVMLAIVKIFRSNFLVHNLTELFIYGGLAVIFVPMLNILYAIILLVLLSLYDMYAVWKSKHMIKMAKFQTKAGIFAGFMIPYGKKIKKKGSKAVAVRSAVLGGGDIGFPLIFAGVILYNMGFASAIIVACFSTLSLFALLMLSKKDKFYPAMPFLTIGCLVGFAVIKLLF